MMFVNTLVSTLHWNTIMEGLDKGVKIYLYFFVTINFYYEIVF